MAQRSLILSNSKTCAVCPVCSLIAPVANLHRSRVCRACSAFFYRYERERRVFICMNNPRACARDAMQTISGYHICKKCRFERCLKEGMRISVDPDTARLSPDRGDERFPLISRVVAALKEMRKRIYQSRPNVIMGTSESGARYLTMKCSADAFVVNAQHFRALLDQSPVICNFASANKGYFFKKTFRFHYMLLIGLNNSQTKQKDTLLIHENMYVDLDEAKLLQFTSSFASEKGATFNSVNYLIVARLLLNHFRSVKSSVVLTIADSIKTEEDIAAFILLIIIQANNFDVDPAKLYLQQDVNQLKAVWKELDLYYTTTRRDPSTWGNLLLFLSSMQTAYSEYMKAINALNEHIKLDVYNRLVKD